jgi:hypothetical protein
MLKELERLINRDGSCRSLGDIFCTLAEALRNEQASTPRPTIPWRNCKMVGRDRRARRYQLSIQIFRLRSAESVLLIRQQQTDKNGLCRINRLEIPHHFSSAELQVGYFVTFRKRNPILQIV